MCRKEITIGNNTIFGENVAVYDHNHIYDGVNLTVNLGFKCKSVKIGNNVWIGSNVVILPGVNIGGNCVIGAGTVVTKDVPSGFLLYDKRETVMKLINDV